MNMDILAVDIKTMSSYDFLQDGETDAELLARANASKQRDIESWTKNCIDYPCEQFEQYLKSAKAKNYKVVTWDFFVKMQKDFYISRPLEEITEEQYNDCLNCLPPLKWCTINGVEMFCMSEMWTGTYTNQYAKFGEKYYTKMADCMDKSTWIYNFLQA